MIAPLHRMNNERLEHLLHDVVGRLKGRTGHWEFSFEDVSMYCFSDESFDRMRIIAPIADIKNLPVGVLDRCMEANFDRTLDVRYCVFQDHLWSAFIHPLSELSEEFLTSALRQLANSVKNFGGSYTSGVLVFTPERAGGGG